MQVKKFIGDTTATVMSMIRKEFGQDAIILQTDKVKTGGILGFFQKEEVHILAALDNEIKRSSDRKSYKDISDNRIVEYKKKSDKNANKYNQIYGSDGRNSIKSEEDVFDVKINSILESPKQDYDVKNDIDEIKKTVNKLSKKINDTFKTEQEEEEYKNQQNWIEKLSDLGISNKLSEEIILSLKEKGLKYTKEIIAKEIISIFSDYIMVDFDENYKNFVFIGSTGVGKTTTLAKIGSKKVIELKKRVGFLTLDTYRISAVEQLKTYAEILSSPIEIAYEIKDLTFSMQKLSNRDCVFIDTAGRSHYNKKQIADLKEILENIENKKVYLVLSANISLVDMLKIIDTYSFLQDYDIIITKVDETSERGKILDVIKKTQKAVRYVAFGQNVPDDIEEFDLKKYVYELLGEVKYD